MHIRCSTQHEGPSGFVQKSRHSDMGPVKPKFPFRSRDISCVWFIVVSSVHATDLLSSCSPSLSLQWLSFRHPFLLTLNAVRGRRDDD